MSEQAQTGVPYCERAWDWAMEYPRVDEHPFRPHYSALSPGVLVLTRLASFLYLTGFYIYDFTLSRTLLNRFLYMTNVGYYFTWIYFGAVVKARLLAPAKGLERYVELLFYVSFCFEIFITVVYWAVLYKFANPEGRPAIFTDVNEHGVPAFLLIVQFVLNSYRFASKHSIFVIFMGLVYALVLNMPYSLAARPVYGAAFNWRSWPTYVFIVINIAVVGLLFLIGRLTFLKCKSPKLLRSVQQQQIDSLKKDDSKPINSNVSIDEARREAPGSQNQEMYPIKN